MQLLFTLMYNITDNLISIIYIRYRNRLYLILYLFRHILMLVEDYYYNALALT